MPHEDMPPDVLADYNEARSIVSRSPKGAAALLRLSMKLKYHNDLQGIVQRLRDIQITDEGFHEPLFGILISLSEYTLAYTRFLRQQL